MKSSLVTVAIPVFNGETTLRACLDSVIRQDYADVEILISDNASTDSTSEICRKFAESNSEVRYIRQSNNIGPADNFLFLLNEAKGKYFIWAACDDVRTPGFLSENVSFLEANPEYVASTSPNCFEGEEDDLGKRVNFSLEGSLEERFISFLENCWQSHGIFYSVIRTEVIRGYTGLSDSFTAADWIVDIYFLLNGKIHRTETELTVFGRKGISNREGALSVFRKRKIERIFPLWEFSRRAVKMA